MKKILLLRQDNRQDAAFFEQKGYAAISLPLSQMKLRALTEVDIRVIKQADWLIFTSQTAVEQVLSVLDNPKVKIAAVGEKTAEKIESFGFQVAFTPEKQTKAGLLAEGNFQGKILYPKSNLADEQLEEVLGAQGLVCYDNLPLNENLAELEQLLAQKSLSAVYLASPSAWRRFYSLYRHYPQALELIAIGETTKRAIEKDSFNNILCKKDL